MRLQDDQKENEQQPVDNGVDEHGREAGLHVHEVHWPGICRMPPEDRSANSAVAMIAGAQSIISHYCAVLRRESSLLNGQRRPRQRRSRAQDYGKFRHTFYNCGSY
jgi:hypothetical protein